MSKAARNSGLTEPVSDADRQKEYFTGVYQRHVATVYRLCYSFLGNPADAEDATQSVFTKLLRNPQTFDSTEHEKAWLIVCAQNHCRDVLKSAYRTRTSFDADASMRAGPTTSDSLDVKDAIFRLPEKYKTCVYLYYYEGYHSKEISRLIDVPDSTVRTYLSEARRLLKESLGGERR